MFLKFFSKHQVHSSKQQSVLQHANSNKMSGDAKLQEQISIRVLNDLNLY